MAFLRRESRHHVLSREFFPIWIRQNNLENRVRELNEPRTSSSALFAVLCLGSPRPHVREGLCRPGALPKEAGRRGPLRTRRPLVRPRREHGPKTRFDGRLRHPTRLRRDRRGRESGLCDPSQGVSKDTNLGAFEARGRRASGELTSSCRQVGGAAGDPGG